MLLPETSRLRGGPSDSPKEPVPLPALPMVAMPACSPAREHPRGRFAGRRLVLVQQKATVSSPCLGLGDVGFRVYDRSLKAPTAVRTSVLRLQHLRVSNCGIQVAYSYL